MTGALSIPATADPSSTGKTGSNAPPPGYHDINSGGTVVRVADQGAPHFHGSESTDDGDKYDPQNANFSRSSSYANKSFDTGQAALSQDGTAEEARNPKSFLTGSYSTRGYNQANRTFQTVAYNDAHPDAGLNKSFTLPSTPYDANQTFNLGQKSSLQNKTALISQKKIDPFSAPDALTEKTFFDPTTLHVPHKSFDLSKSIRSDPNSAGTITDVPNRALSVDEVRDLINHEQVPDLSAKPDGPSKPLNDPSWAPPEVAPPALDDRPIKPGPTTEDRSDELPSPGMIAQPPATPSR